MNRRVNSLVNTDDKFKSGGVLRDFKKFLTLIGKARKDDKAKAKLKFNLRFLNPKLNTLSGTEKKFLDLMIKFQEWSKREGGSILKGNNSIADIKDYKSKKSDELKLNGQLLFWSLKDFGDSPVMRNLWLDRCEDLTKMLVRLTNMKPNVAFKKDIKQGYY